MTLQQLKYVVEIARHGSINQAAQHLFISQPSLSNSLKELEEELDIHIFYRSSTGIKISSFKKGELSEAEYKESIREKTADFIVKQEEIGLDVILHGEYERNDMVEYFGQNLDGYLFTGKLGFSHMEHVA